MRIALFVTCLADALFPRAAIATVELLERLGHDVVFPPGQTCCGQMHVNTGYLAEAAALGVPVLLDGLMSVACALLADRLAPGAAQWFAAGHRSTEPAQSLALAKLGLERRTQAAVLASKLLGPDGRPR